MTVATQYDFHGEADVSTPGLCSLAVATTGGARTDAGLIIRDGLYVDAYRVEPGERMSAAALLGFDHRITMVFRFANNRPAEVRDRNLVLMVATVLRCFAEHPGRGVLLYNGERVTVQRLGADVEFDSEWEDWAEVAGVVPLVADRPLRRLGQPLL